MPPGFILPLLGYSVSTMTNSAPAANASPLAQTRPPLGEKSVSVIFNPVSGSTDPEERKKTISDALAAHGYTCQYLSTSKEEGANALAKKALADGVDLIAVSGGDGTVMEVLSALVGTNIPVAVLPAGTGNLLSINLGIPTTVPDAVEVALGGLPYKLDLVKMDEHRYFAIMGGMGLDAQMIADADRDAKRKFGPFAYFWAVAKNLRRQRVLYEISLDDGPPMRHRAKTVMVANMGKITGGVDAIPTASPSDGLLDIGILKAHTFGQGLRLIGNALLGRAHEDPMLVVHQARKMRIVPHRPQLCELDGESIGRIRDWQVEVVPQAVQILLPKDAPATRGEQSPPEVAARRSARQRLIAPLVVIALLSAGIYAWRRRR